MHGHSLSQRALDLVAPGGLLPLVYAHLGVPAKSWPALLNLPSLYMSDADTCAYCAPTGEAANAMDAEELKEAQAEEARQHERVRLRQQARRFEMADMYMGVLDPEYVPPVRVLESRNAVEMKELESVDRGADRGVGGVDAGAAAGAGVHARDSAGSSSAAALGASSGGGDVHSAAGGAGSTSAVAPGGGGGAPPPPATAATGGGGGGATKAPPASNAAGEGGSDAAPPATSAAGGGGGGGGGALCSADSWHPLPESLPEGDWHPLARASSSSSSEYCVPAGVDRGSVDAGVGAGQPQQGQQAASAAAAGAAGPAAAAARGEAAVAGGPDGSAGGEAASRGGDVHVVIGSGDDGALAATDDPDGGAAPPSASASPPRKAEPSARVMVSPRFLLAVSLIVESCLSVEADGGDDSDAASEYGSDGAGPSGHSGGGTGGGRGGTGGRGFHVRGASASSDIDAYATASGSDADASVGRGSVGRGVAGSGGAYPSGCSVLRPRVEPYDARSRTALYALARWMRVGEAQVRSLERLHTAQQALMCHRQPQLLQQQQHQQQQQQQAQQAQQRGAGVGYSRVSAQADGGGSHRDMQQAALAARAAADAQGDSRLVTGLKVGGVATAAGILLAITGGLAAPAIAAGLGGLVALAGGGAAASAAVAGGLGTMAGTAAISGGLGAYGAGIGAHRTHRMVSGVSEFGYVDLGSSAWAESRVLACAEQVVEEEKEAGGSAGAGAAAGGGGGAGGGGRGAAGGAGGGSGWAGGGGGGGGGGGDGKKAVSPSPSSSSLVSLWWSGQQGPLLLEVPFSSNRAEDGAATVTIAVNGWLKDGPEDFFTPWVTCPNAFGNRFALVWETDLLTGLGGAITRMVRDKVLQEAGTQLLKAAALGSLLTAFALPMAAMGALNMVLGDKWGAALRRAKVVGVLLAHQLAGRCAGGRPVTLVAFSMGARVVFHCLLELQRLGRRGIVENAVLMGTPVQVNENTWAAARSVVNENTWAAARSVVSGRLVNVYSDNDWVLGLLYRSKSVTSLINHVSGLHPVEGVRGVENVGVAKLVGGHEGYMDAMAEVLEMLQLDA
ncbi:hypothetical protein FOA52_006246 [Chlamydomonas sp. UWO 241]|nr:hypothetical protein FOA52_006246 [Chlamydomonas sp. UWO 241]